MYTKEDEKTMSESITSKTLYNIDELVAKKESLENHKQHLINVWDAKIAKVDVLIDEAKALGIKETVEVTK